MSNYNPDCIFGISGCNCAEQASADYADSKNPNSLPDICGDQGCSKSADEPAFLISESKARPLVTAIENGHAGRAIEIIKSFPWFETVRGGIRATRHLKPADYIKLSERGSQLSPQ